MRERKAGQDGQNIEDPFPTSSFVDHRTGKVYRIRDYEGDIRRATKLDLDGGAFGNSSLLTLRNPAPSRGRHTRGTPLEDSS